MRVPTGFVGERIFFRDALIFVRRERMNAG